LELPEVEELFVFPSCGDETNAIGAAYHLQAQANLEAQQMPGIAPLTAVYWGQDITDSEVEAALKDFQFSCPIQVEVPQDIEATVARVLAKGEIVARAKGRMEFGARSLGNRSILARADDRDVVHTINSMIKMRDFWMPFAPSILSERMDDYVIRVKPMVAPYMIIAFDTQPGAKDKCIAAIHPYDHTCRPQEVISTWNPDYYRLISSYQEITGEGIILNTSFNLHGYPIVCSPLDALRVFDNSGLTRLALGSVLITKR
jgi:carbamoyltransferase